MSKIITFYSFKGGVGRSMALANVAWLMALRGKKVLVVDWDLEAPGLHRFFDIHNSQISGGIMDIIYDYKKVIQDEKQDNLPDPLVDIDKYILRLTYSEKNGPPFYVSILPAGRQNEEYITNLEELNWKAFFKEFRGYGFIKYLLKLFIDKGFDYILIDSRTGFTDISGVCTMALPDVVVLLFTYNQQNIDGIKIAVDKTRAFSKNNERKTPEIILRASRVDTSVLHSKDKWQRIAIQKFGPLLFDKDEDNATNYSDKEQGNTMDYRNEDMDYFDEVSFPYLPMYAYGETPLIAKEFPNERLARSYGKLVDKLLGESIIANEKKNTVNPQLLIVDKKGQGYNKINDAINASKDNDTIWVMSGFYDESIIISKKIELIGMSSESDQNPQKPIIASNSSCTVELNSNFAILKNFCIKQQRMSDNVADNKVCALLVASGTPTIEDCDISYSDSHGMIVESGSSPTVLRNRIYYCRSNGIYLTDGAKGTIEDNYIYANQASGVLIENKAEPIIQHNQIHDNRFGIMIKSGGKGSIKHNNIYKNKQSGILIQESIGILIEGNQINENEDEGILVSESGDANLLSNDIHKNKIGVKVTNDTSHLKIESNKIHENAKQGVMVDDGATAELIENDIYNNAKQGVNISNRGNAVLTSNTIHQCKHGGVFIQDNAVSTINSNNIYDNLMSGIAISNAIADVNDNNIYSNRGYGIYEVNANVVNKDKNILENNALGSKYP